MNKQLLTALIGAALSAPLSHAEMVSQNGVTFDLTANLANDPIAHTLRNTLWDGDLEKLLAGYNYETILRADGRPARVVISGHNGSGHGAPMPTGAAASALADGDLLTYQPAVGPLPEKYRELAPGSVTEITLPIDKLNHMKLGERIHLNLPVGTFEVVHDNRFEHVNGDVTWVGQLDGAGAGYRVIITSGREGSVGQIVTPEGVYNIDLEGGRNWLVDIDSSGLSSGSLENDQAMGDGFAAAEAEHHHADAGPFMGATAPRAKARTVIKPAPRPVPMANTTSSTTSTQTTKPTIDLFILYTQGLGSAVGTRLNYLVAKANQAYIDSGIRLNLRLVGQQLVDYTNSNSNSTALSDLTYGRSIFSSVSALRKQYGADLVSLIRPFQYKSQQSCGVAWVNGANGGAFYAGLGYSVVSDGIDGGGTRYYCTDYTLTHELGHNLGSVHDQAHSSFQGAYAFSYGYGKPGVFGTIMSYYNPVVGLFSNPLLTCKGEPCGNATSADNSRSINSTAPKVAGFVPTTR